MDIGELIATVLGDTLDLLGLPNVVGHLKEVQWGSDIPVARNKAAVQKPHWVAGVDVEDKGGTSQRAAVHLISSKGAPQPLKVKVQITKADRVSGNGVLTGRLGDLELEGTFPVSVGEHTVEVKIKNPPDVVAWYRGNASWVVDSPALPGPQPLGTTRLEVFFVADRPVPRVYSSPGVWVEALRTDCGRAGVDGLKDPKDIVAAVTGYCHARGMKYDTMKGASKHNVGQLGGVFNLSTWLAKSPAVVNCYDQAAAVDALCAAVGVSVTWLFLAPFGYIRTTNLVGVGSCNNPFYSGNGTPKEIAPDHPGRTSFGNHAFTVYGGILDACAGPHTGTESNAQYMSASIDYSRWLYDRDRKLYPQYFGAWWKGGTPAELVSGAGVTGVQ